MKDKRSDYLSKLRRSAELETEKVHMRLSTSDPESLLHELKVHHIELEMQNHELRDTQLQLLKAKDAYARLYNQSPVGYATLNAAGQIIEVNESFQRMVELPAETIRRKHFAQLITDDYQGIFRQRFKAFFKTPVGKTIEVALATSQLEPFYVELQGYHLPLQDAEDKQLLAINIIDKTAQRSIENSLFLAENIIGVIPDGVIITNVEGEILNINPALSALTGYSSNELIGKPASILRAKRHNNINFQTILSSLENQEVWQGRLWSQRKDKTEYLSEVTTTAVYKPKQSEQPLYYLHILRDISRQTRLEQQLQQTQKMESLGTMVSGLAHNFNNLLAGMKGNLFLLQRDQQTSEKSQLRLKNIDELADRAAGLLRQLLSFARKNQEEKVSTDICEVVNSVVALHRAAIPENISLDLSVPDQQVNVICNQNQLMQLILNLLINSVHALKRTVNPRISVTLEQSNWSKCGSTMKKGPVALLKIIDNGCGIEEASLTKIFDPFFTTKDVDEGTGLGLSTVYGTVKEMGGEISVESRVDEGTMFSICLPTSAEIIAPISINESRPIVSGNGEKIIIVDDSQAIRSTLKDVFTSMNYQVVTARNGAEGMRQILSDPEISLLLTDAIMPETSGIELIQSLRKMGNEIPAILITANPEIMDDEAQQFNYQLVRKPFDIVDLSHRVKILIDK